jgi:hypothetical protein
MAKTREAPFRFSWIPSIKTLLGLVGVGYALLALASIGAWPFSDPVVRASLYGLSIALLSVGGALLVISPIVSDTFKKIIAMRAGDLRLIMLIAAEYSILVLSPVSFGGLCQNLFLLFGGFAGGAQSQYDWFIFALSWLTDTCTFNVTQIFGWVTTSIYPTAWWSRILVSLFCFVADVILFGSATTIILWPLRRSRSAQ